MRGLVRSSDVSGISADAKVQRPGGWEQGYFFYISPTQKTHKVMLVRNNLLGSELLIPEIMNAERSSRQKRGSRVSSLLSETESSVKVG